MEVACFSKTSVSTYKTTRFRNQENHSVLVSVFKNVANFLPIITVFCNRFISLKFYSLFIKIIYCKRQLLLLYRVIQYYKNISGLHVTHRTS